MDVFTGAGEVVTTRPGRRALRHLPQLLRLARLRHPAADLARARCPTGSRLRHVRFDDPGLLAKTIADDRRHRRVRRPPRRRARRRRVRAGGVLPDVRHLGRRGEDAAAWHERPSDYTGQQVYYRSLQQREHRPADDVRLPVALGHRLVLVLRRVRRPAPRRPPAVAAPLAALRRLPQAGRPGPPLRHRRPARPPGRAARARAGDPGRRGAGRPARRVPGLVRRGDRDAAGLAVPGAGHARTGRSTRSTPTSPTSTSASGAPSTSGPRPPTPRATARSRPRSSRSPATSRCTPRRSTTARPSTSSTTAPTSPG